MPPKHLRRHFSPLTLRILAVNLIAPLLLLAGVLYLDQYEDALIEADLKSLRIQADVIAAAVAESAVTAESGAIDHLSLPITSHHLAPTQARTVVRRLAGLGGIRAQLFDPNGLLVADSKTQSTGDAPVQVVDLVPSNSPPPSPDEAQEHAAWAVQMLQNLYETGLHFFSSSPASLPQYVDRLEQSAADYPEVVTAIEVGIPATAVRRRDAETRVLSAAVPVQYYKNIVGVVLVARNDDDIRRSLFDVRWAIGKLFIGTLAVTVLLSLYLANAIARPVRRLAEAAEAVRCGEPTGKGRVPVLPDLSQRHDEIGELSVSLRSMTQALWDRLDAIERFAADVAHELKNPLTSLRSAVETVMRVDNPVHQKKLLAIIQDDIGRLDRLISDISDASRLDAELSRAESQRVPLAPMLSTLGEVYAPAAAERGVTVCVKLPPNDSLTVEGIEDRLVQVVRNLIGNALSFSPSGSTLILRGRRELSSAIIEVIDQGVGIPPGKEKAIFARFYSERPKDEKFGTHSGLGLSISQQIIEAHHGNLVAENMCDGDTILGARFTIRLPLAPELPKSTPLPSKRILNRS